MKARCDWCGIQVEVLSDGKCLLGHPMRVPKGVALADAPSPPAPIPPSIGPARSSRVRSTSVRPVRKPKAPRLGEMPAMERARETTAAPARPRMTDPPTHIPADAAARLSKAAREVPRYIAPPAPETTKTLRKWMPTDPFGPSGPVEIVIDEPVPAVEIRDPSLAAAVEALAPRVAKRARPASLERAPSATSMPAAPRAPTAPSRAPKAAAREAAAAVAGAVRSVDWRTGAEKARDATLLGLRRAATATAAAGRVVAGGTRTAGRAVARIDFRAAAKRIGPISPQNPVVWVAGLSVAAVALLVGFLAPGSGDTQTRVLGERLVAHAELTQVPGYVVEDDPATEAEVKAGQPGAQKVAAAKVRDNDKVVASYQAITFGPDVRWSHAKQEDWLARYASGAGIPADSFAERPLGARDVWSAPLDAGQVVVVFRDSEVVVLVTGEAGYGGDMILDAVLTARGL